MITECIGWNITVPRKATKTINSIIIRIEMIMSVRQENTLWSREKETCFLNDSVGIQKEISFLLTGRIYQCLERPLRIMWQPIGENSQLPLSYLQKMMQVQCILKRNQRNTSGLYHVPLGMLQNLFVICSLYILLTFLYML